MQFTHDQKNALNAVNLLIADNHPALVIDGSAGTGKSTIIKEIIERSAKEYAALAKLTDSKPKEVWVTATTNKAVEALQHSIGYNKDLPKVQTIHSALGIRLDRNKQCIFPKGVAIKDTLIICDEYSYIDEDLLDYINYAMRPSSSIIFVGDNCQLPPVNSNGVIPVVERNYPTVHLTEQVRQESSVLKYLASELKEFVITGEYEAEVEPDGKSFIYYEDEDEELFIQNLKEAYSKGSCRYISYQNSRVAEINNFLFEELKQRGEFQQGDWVVNNTYFSGKTGSLKTDQVVPLFKVRKGSYPLTFKEGTSVEIPGVYVDTYRLSNLFIPSEYKFHKLIDETKLTSHCYHLAVSVWVDLRPQYACTAHKSQGSTYDRVFIDATDFSKIQDSNTLARLLYVAMSRSRKELHIIGEI